jgi:hypothetical protein
MKKYLIGLVALIIVLGCKKTKNSNCDDRDLMCGDINCLVMNYTFDFRIIDKASGADLVFGSNPRYTAADIKLYQDAAATIPINLVVDQSRSLFHTMAGRNTMYLRIGRGIVLKLDADYKAVACCENRVKNLKVQGQDVCTCCADVIAISDN